MAQAGYWRLPAMGGDGFVKLFDGTMIQWGRVGVSIPDGSAYVDQVVTYPQPFVGDEEIAVVTSLAAVGPTTSTLAYVCVPTASQINGTNKLTQFTLRTYRQSSAGTSGNPTPSVCWMAFGRWY